MRFTVRVRPPFASQLTNCLGAGTGCGWCIPTLIKIHAHVGEGDAADLDTRLPVLLHQSPDEYAAARAQYLQEKEKNTF